MNRHLIVLASGSVVVSGFSRTVPIVREADTSLRKAELTLHEHALLRDVSASLTLTRAVRVPPDVICGSADVQVGHEIITLLPVGA